MHARGNECDINIHQLSSSHNTVLSLFFFFLLPFSSCFLSIPSTHSSPHCSLLLSNEALSPFCDTPEDASPARTGCTVDHEAVSKCNLVSHSSPLPAEFRVANCLVFIASEERVGLVLIIRLLSFINLANM